MNSTHSTSLGAAVQPAKQPVLPQQAEIRRSDAMAAAAAAAAPLSAQFEVTPKAVGYGLPCAKCKTYFAANLTACPVCKNTERVSANAVLVPAIPVSAEELPDPQLLEEERERFLREFQAQVYASQLQLTRLPVSAAAKKKIIPEVLSRRRSASPATTICRSTSTSSKPCCTWI